MLDKFCWSVFEKTGDIDAYLLYANMKDMNGVKEMDIDLKGHVTLEQ